MRTFRLFAAAAIICLMSLAAVVHTATEIVAQVSSPSAAPTTTTTATVPPAVTQNTVTTTGPVTSETTISVGTVIGQVMLVVWTAFGGVLLYYCSTALQKLAVRFGIQVSDAKRAEYADSVLHAINLVAPRAAQEFAGKGHVEIKNATVAYAIDYMRTHHDELGKSIGIDASKNEGQERIKAQIETAIIDPTIPTPKMLDATVTPPAPARR